jgi:hypothetical protein
MLALCRGSSHKRVFDPFGDEEIGYPDTAGDQRSAKSANRLDTVAGRNRLYDLRRHDHVYNGA